MPIVYSDGPYILDETFAVPLTDLTTDESRRAFAYWQQKCGDADVPSWHDIDFLDLPVGMIPTMIVVDVLQEENDFLYRFFGTGQVATHRAVLTGQRVSSLPSEGYRAAVLQQYTAVVTQHTPVAVILRALLNNVRYEAEVLRLPLRVSGDAIEKIWVIETLT